MTNIWGFCLQTVTVSLAAALLLLVKWLLRDKLSPRWQYGVWGVLALRILIPANISRGIIGDLGLWVETGKAVAERGLDSAYSAAFEPVSMGHILPVIQETPVSLTDWLFVIYLAGVAVSMGWYLISYMVLRLRLGRGSPASPAVREKISNVRLRRWFGPWKVVHLEGVSAAFVCGVFRPVLVVPQGEDIDEKVLLHELLHLQYRDALQNVFWAAARCLHWCNPFLHYIFNRIGNDMESLCDQRVLERLEGEERREYGMILLTMANNRYARTPGTTSISNGGRNIARRIEAIVRFKQYPRGMTLVSVCIALVLLSPVLVGTAAAYDQDDYRPGTLEELPRAMAAARTRRCTTVAGAIDTYAKGILSGNGIFAATAAPLSGHEALQARLEREYSVAGNDLWRLDPGYGLEYLDAQKGYGIYDLVSNEDGSCHCYITFGVTDFADPAHRNWPTTADGVEIVEGTVIIPLRIFREGEAWVVEERAERILASQRFGQIEYYGDDMPWLLEKEVECETGTVHISHRTVYQIDNAVTTNSVLGWTGWDGSLKPDAEFSGGWLKHQYIYQMDPDSPVKPVETVTMEVMELDSPEAVPEFEDFSDQQNLSGEYVEASGSSNTGASFQTKHIDQTWNGRMESGGGSSLYGSLEDGGLIPALPGAYAFRITFDGEVVEELLIGGFGDEKV